jgi:hypothetical protein
VSAAGCGGTEAGAVGTFAGTFVGTFVGTSDRTLAVADAADFDAVEGPSVDAQAESRKTAAAQRAAAPLVFTDRL